MVSINDGWDVASLLTHSAFDELGQADKIARFDVSQVDAIPPNQCFDLMSEAEYRRMPSLRIHLIKAVVLFQAGMESLVSYLSSKYPTQLRGKNFFKQIENVLPKDQTEAYFKFYGKVRVSIVHPTEIERIETIRDLQFIYVHQGLRYGWEIFSNLSAKLNERHDTNSWNIMCDLHHVIVDPTEENYPDFNALSSKLAVHFLNFHNNGNSQKT